MSIAAAIATEALSLLPTAARSALASAARHEGPGWFDSSWELSEGLQVKEGLPADLGLSTWIDSWLQIAAGEGAAALSLSAR